MENYHVVISDTPHIRCKRTTKHIMLDVIIALIPVFVASIVYFGWLSLFNTVLCVFSCVATECVYLLCQKKKIDFIIKQFDFTSIVTGLLLAFTLPPLDYSLWYIPVISGIFSIAVVKMLFGGTGKNIVNPAIAGRVFSFIAFQKEMNGNYITANFSALKITNVINSGATPLTSLLEGQQTLSNLDLLLGTGLSGCIGETCKIAIIVGFIYLVARKVIKWQWPIIYIGVTGLISVFMSNFDFCVFLPSILSGGLMLGAVFMATDYVTSPNNKLACYIYYILLGVVTALLRFGTKIEVVSFAILLMNLLVPLFNNYIKPRPFGAKPISLIIKEKIATLKKKKSPDCQEGGKQ